MAISSNPSTDTSSSQDRDMVGTYEETAGDPGQAATLPVTTGRAPEDGTPDEVYVEENV